MKNSSRRGFLKLAGAAMVGVTGVASAFENPFGFKAVESDSLQVASEGKCGGKQPEGKCGGKQPEGKCGGKQPEGKCGAKS